MLIYSLGSGKEVSLIDTFGFFPLFPIRKAHLAVSGECTNWKEILKLGVSNLAPTFSEKNVFPDGGEVFSFEKSS